MEEEKKDMFKMEVVGGTIKADLDLDRDGDPILKAEIFSKEALEEILKRGVAKDGVKVADVDASLSNIEITIDSDKDGEPSMKVIVSLKELLDQVF